MTTTSPIPRTIPALRLAHAELRVDRLPTMLAFYADVLGFVVTDRAESPDAMAFLSRSPDEHHQIVLTQSRDPGPPRRLDHLAFRIGSLADLQGYRRSLGAVTTVPVFHGSSWSFYVTDPEGNRLEFFADTPWHVDQPASWPVDLDAPEPEVRTATAEVVARRPDRTDLTTWARRHRTRFAPVSGGGVAHRRVEIVAVGEGPSTGEVRLSSHATSEGIVSYFRRPDGSTVIRTRPLG